MRNIAEVSGAYDPDVYDCKGVRLRKGDTVRLAASGEAGGKGSVSYGLTGPNLERTGGA